MSLASYVKKKKGKSRKFPQSKYLEFQVPYLINTWKYALTQYFMHKTYFRLIIYDV